MPMSQANWDHIFCLPYIRPTSYLGSRSKFQGTSPGHRLTISKKCQQCGINSLRTDIFTNGVNLDFRGLARRTHPAARYDQAEITPSKDNPKHLGWCCRSKRYYTISGKQRDVRHASLITSGSSSGPNSPKISPIRDRTSPPSVHPQPFLPRLSKRLNTCRCLYASIAAAITRNTSMLMLCSPFSARS